MSRFRTSDLLALIGLAGCALTGIGLILFATTEGARPSSSPPEMTPTPKDIVVATTPPPTLTPAPTREPAGASEDQESDDATDQTEQWEGTERINVLVMGIDQREQKEVPSRTDTMLLLTIDPATMTAGVLSIPRDLWVPIPGHGRGRINTAHYLGEKYRYPGGGPALAASTVSYNLGVPIHHYIRVDFDAFEQLVDLIGGIDIYVEQDIYDPAFPDEAYGYDPLYIPAGQHHFDGEIALKYARTRHTGRGDFARAKRQQQVLMAMFNKVTRLDMLPELLPQAPHIWRTLQDSVVTDSNLALDRAIALARLASQVEPESIRYSVIDEECTRFWTAPDGQKVLIPLRNQIQKVLDYVFSTERSN